jgi:hypothetical protein
MAKNDKSAANGANGKGKPAKKKGGKANRAGSEGISVAGHPRAAAAVKRAKGIGGLGGFALAAYFSYRAHVPVEQVALRALAVGIAGYMLAWACSVTVWRQLVLAEFHAAVDRRAPELEPAHLGVGTATAAEDTPAPTRND